MKQEERVTDKAYYFSKEFREKSGMEKLKKALLDAYNSNKAVTVDFLVEITGLSLLSLYKYITRLEEEGFRIRSIRVYEVLKVPKEAKWQDQKDGRQSKKTLFVDYI